MTMLRLFIAFLEVGAFAFGGGYAVLPLIERVIVHRYGWLTMTEMTDVVSISQVTPGPIALNAATFVGMRVAGIPGAIIASVATVPPHRPAVPLRNLLFSGKEILHDRSRLHVASSGRRGINRRIDCFYFHCVCLPFHIARRHRPRRAHRPCCRPYSPYKARQYLSARLPWSGHRTYRRSCRIFDSDIKNIDAVS